MQGEIPVVKLAQVISVYDEQGGDRIKVKLMPEDATIQNREVMYCWPLLPKMLHVKPKKGETVLVLNAIGNNSNSQRYYIGPVISQESNMEDETNPNVAKSMFIGGILAPGFNQELDPDTYGAFSNNEDITIYGRRSSEVQLKLNEARLKAGVRLSESVNRNNIYFNTESPSFVKLKYHETDETSLGNEEKIGSKGYKSTATVVADKIFLLGNVGKGARGKNDTFDTTNVKYSAGEITDDLITDEELNRALKDAHQLPYGDVLIDFLKVLLEAFKMHTHDYATLPPNPRHLVELNKQEKIILEEKNLLSDNVRVN